MRRQLPDGPLRFYRCSGDNFHYRQYRQSGPQHVGYFHEPARYRVLWYSTPMQHRAALMASPNVPYHSDAGKQYSNASNASNVPMLAISWVDGC